MDIKNTQATSELIASQWVWLDDLLEIMSTEFRMSDDDAKRLLLINAVTSVVPILIEYNGSHTVVRNIESPIATEIDSVLRYKLGEPTEQFSTQTIVDANYTNIAFSLPSLCSWLKTKNLDLCNNEWHKWMKSSYPILKSLGLLEIPDTQPTQNEDSKMNQSDLTVDYSKLKALSGHRTPATVIAWLTTQNIPYQTGIRNRPFTTIEAINSALRLSESREDTKRTISV